MKTTERGNKMYRQMCSVFKKQGLNFKEEEDRLRIYFIMNGNDLPMKCFMRIDAERELIIFQSPLPFNFSKEKMVEGAVAICSVNYSLRYGGFDLDIRDGQILFRLVCSFRDCVINDDLFKILLGTAVSTTDEYNDKFQALNEGKMKSSDFIPKS